MKVLINLKKWEALRLGGITFDRRTWAGKDLIKRTRNMNTTKYVDGLVPGLTNLRVKDLNDFFDFELRNN